MEKTLVKDGLMWGAVLWLLGYVLGIVFFAIIPRHLIGWAVMPLGIAATVYVLAKRINSRNFSHYLQIAVIWTVLAVLCDYLFLVRLIRPEDGYYKPDVYIYYSLTFLLPVTAGWLKRQPLG